MTHKLQTSILKPTKQNINKAAQLILKGEVVAIPTETVYGLAANAYSNEAVNKIFIVKNRPQDNPLICHISNMEMLKEIVSEISEDALKLAKEFWPGPLTIIFNKNNAVCSAVSANLNTVAVRMPLHSVALQIINAAGVPIAAPSANVSGRPSPTTAQDVLNDLSGKISTIIDGEQCDVGLESTVLSIEGEHPVILRPGTITKQDIERVLNKQVVISGSVLNEKAHGEKIMSPGMKYKHYSPNAELTLVCANTEKYTNFVNEKAASENDVFALCYKEDETLLNCPYITYGAQNDFKQQAKNLFTCLRKLDEQGAKVAYAHCNEKSGTALAVYNRLIRACAFKVVEL